MDALLTVVAYDCRMGNAADHYYSTFESIGLGRSTLPLEQIQPIQRERRQE